MKNIHIVFSTIVNEKGDFFTESLGITEEMTIEQMTQEIQTLLDSYNRVEVSRYGADVFQRKLKRIVGYIPMNVKGERSPEVYGEYKSFSEVPKCVLNYCSENLKTKSAYLVKKFDSSLDGLDDVLVVM